MSDASLELDSARSILTTYQQIHDVPMNQRLLQAKLGKKNKDLTKELDKLKEQYLALQQELVNRDKRLAHLSRELIDRTTDMTRLREDFEHAIYQMTHKNIVQKI
jgi:predicted  nucleic acid-binding Zn-ribbon protein